MTRYPKSSPFVPIHDCYSEKLVFDLEKDRWQCPVCGEPYNPPGHCNYVFPPEERPAFFKPFWTEPPDLEGSKGRCNGSFVLEPGDKVHLADIKADVLVFWKPWIDYSKR